jgi:hypothetical protein
MKEIQSITIWYNGKSYQATIFNMSSISDNLIDTANFYYQLLTSDEFQIATGNITMAGFDYDAYTTSPDSNAYAYQWGAEQLKLTLV